MADVHYEVDETEKPGRDLMDTMRDLSKAWDKFTRLRGVMLQKKITGAAGNDQFTQVADSYGYSGIGTGTGAGSAVDNAADSFAEIDSAFNTGDAAITQMLNRHL